MINKNLLVVIIAFFLQTQQATAQETPKKQLKVWIINVRVPVVR